MDMDIHIERRKAATLYKIKSEDCFTLSAATKMLDMRKDNLPGAIRCAVSRVARMSGSIRPETFAWFYGDGFNHKRSRSFHVAVCRPLSPEERHHIAEQFKETCWKENWGDPELFFRWGIHLTNNSNQYSTAYLDNHPQKWLVKVNAGEVPQE